ncbi:hypothetical protein HDU82_000579 [Entophlyctis luteolus]|nr:hypothetical protein HDU82_000579 [Entophlyctis luteolus]
MEPSDEDVVMWGLNRTAASPPTAAHHSFSNNASFSLAGLGLSSLSFDERIVLDIGSRLLKVGLSGEEQPRCVLPIFVASIDSPSTNAGLYEPGLDSRLMARRRRVLTDMLRMVYTRLVLTDPKQRKVVICDKVLMPMAIKQMVIEILFDVFETPALNFVSSDMLSLMCTGKSSGMVVDIGYLEATAVPVTIFEFKKL